MKIKDKVAVIAMCIGIFLCMLDTTIMNITLPAIQEGLNVELSDLSWALNIYTIVFAALTIPLGRIAELYGRNKVYIVGLVIFVLGSVGCGFSRGVGYLIVFRAFQSIGAAIVFPTSMVIGISKTSVEKRQNVIAALGVTQGLAAALGPTIGGVVTQYLGWRWVFFINVPLILLALMMCFYALGFKNEEKIQAKIDGVGASLSVLFLFTLTLSLVKGREWSWTSVPIISLLISSILFFILFIKYEQKCKYPMIPIQLFTKKQFVGASITVVLSNLFLIGVTVVLPTFLTTVQGEDELHAAFLVTPLSAMIFIFSPLAAILIKKLGSRIVIFTGFLAMTIAYISFSNLDVSHNYTQMIVTCLLLGFGYGIIVGPITVLAAADFTDELLTASQSVIGVLRQIGTVLAVAIFVSSLTGNIGNAKKETMEYAKNEIYKLDLSDSKKEFMYKQTQSKIINEQKGETTTEHVNKEERQSLIDENYSAVLKENKLTQPTEELEQKIRNQVAEEVDLEIDLINSKINQTIEKINGYAQEHITDSFLKLYMWAIPFVFLSCIVTFLFPSKEKC